MNAPCVLDAEPPRWIAHSHATMWIKRTNEQQTEVKVSSMSAPVQWNDNGTANPPEEDAKALIEDGQAEEYNAEDEDGGESAATDDTSEDTE